MHCQPLNRIKPCRTDWLWPGRLALGKLALLDPAVIAASDAHARRALAPLARLAERHRCAILLVRHLAKQGGRRALYRGGGSIGIVGACRSGWLLAPDPHQPQRRVLAEVK